MQQHIRCFFTFSVLENRGSPYHWLSAGEDACRGLFPFSCRAANRGTGQGTFPFFPHRVPNEGIQRRDFPIHPTSQIGFSRGVILLRFLSESAHRDDFPRPPVQRAWGGFLHAANWLANTSGRGELSDPVRQIGARTHRWKSVPPHAVNCAANRGTGTLGKRIVRTSHAANRGTGARGEALSFFPPIVSQIRGEHRGEISPFLPSCRKSGHRRRGGFSRFSHAANCRTGAGGGFSHYLPLHTARQIGAARTMSPISLSFGFSDRTKVRRSFQQKVPTALQRRFLPFPLLFSPILLFAAAVFSAFLP